MDIADALEAYLVQLRANERSPHTVAQAARHVGLLAAWAGQVRRSGDVHAIRPEDLAEFLPSDTARLRPSGAAEWSGPVWVR